MAREVTVYGYQATLLTVGIGLSNVLFVKPIGREISCQLKMFAGGSLEIFHAPPGSTSAIGATISLGSGYMLGATEVVKDFGAPRYFLAATGATAQAYLLVGLSSDFGGGGSGA